MAMTPDINELLGVLVARLEVALKSPVDSLTTPLLVDKWPKS